MTAEELPAELHPQSTTIEYAFPQGSDGLSPAFVFVGSSLSSPNLQSIS